MDSVLVGLGAACGGICRYQITRISQRYNLTPWSTVCINVIGSMSLGAIVAKQQHISSTNFIFATTGFCGGFTTFSTFSFDVISLIESGLYSRAMILVFLSNSLGISGAYIGYRLVKSSFYARKLK